MANVKVYVCENGVMCSVIRDAFSVLMQVLLFLCSSGVVRRTTPGYPTWLCT